MVPAVILAAPPAAEVVSRDRWAAAPPRAPYAQRGRLRAVILHHTQIAAAAIAHEPAHEAEYVRNIQRLHLARGWDDIGYHFVVMRSGRVFRGRPAWALGAHVAGHNTGTVSIAVAGDYDVEEPTRASLDAIAAIRRHLVDGSAGVPLLAHGDLAERRCPGRLLRERLAGELADLSAYEPARRRSAP